MAIAHGQLLNARDRSASAVAFYERGLARIGHAWIGRGRTGEDLIGDLFETMHELHFMPDMVSGAEFVQNVLSQTLPCDGTLIHVFDINKREFVVVRASGPSARDALLHVTSDPDPLFSQVMRSTSVFRADSVQDDERFKGGRWEKVGVAVESVLVGGVKQGGRYLGVIELANPLGGEPFSEGETAVEPYTVIEATQPDANVAVLDGPDLETLVSGLNRLGVKPDGIIAILQGIKSAGALQADLVLQ